MKNALIAGASGLVGTELLKLMLEDKSYDKIFLLVRKPINIQNPRIVQVEQSLDRLSEYTPPFPINDVFCALGTTIKVAGSQEAFRKVDYDYVLEVGKLGERIKAEKFLIVSAMGANASSSIFYNRVKGEMEKSASQLSIPGIFVFRPSLLMGKRKEYRAGEKFAQAVLGNLGFLFFGKLKQFKAISGTKVAMAMLKSAASSETGFRVIESGEMNV